MSIFSRLFHREPRYHTSAYGTVYAALVARLRREGVHVGGTAGYPRIDCHSFTEGERQDKDGRLRQISCTVECMSNRSKTEVMTLNEENLRLLTEEDIDVGEGWVCLGIVPGTMTDIDETSDPQKILYRLLQEVEIFIEKSTN